MHTQTHRVARCATKIQTKNNLKKHSKPISKPKAKKHFNSTNHTESKPKKRQMILIRTTFLFILFPNRNGTWKMRPRLKNSKMCSISVALFFLSAAGLTRVTLFRAQIDTILTRVSKTKCDQLFLKYFLSCVFYFSEQNLSARVRVRIEN